MRSGRQLLPGLLGLVLLAAQPAHLPAADRERVFPEHRCRYALPGPDWTWANIDFPKALFVATNSSDFLMTVSCAPFSDGARLNPEVARKFETAIEREAEGELKKRGDRYIMFQGLNCYQFEGVYATGRTSVHRLILTQDRAYHLMLIGNKEPVERDAEFESIMNGFAITDGAVQNGVGAAGQPNSGTKPTSIAALITVLLCATGLAFRIMSTLKQPKKEKRPLVEFDDEFPVRRAGSRRRYDEYDREPSAIAVDAETGLRTYGKGGRCSGCGYEPVAFGARTCPNCGKSNPNPGVGTRYGGRGAFGGLIAGCLAGAIWGYFDMGPGGIGMAFGGMLLGALAGLVVGLMGGLSIALVAWLCGKR